MPYVAPILLSALVHTIVAFWAIITSILSAWKNHRVGLAEAACPSFDDVPPAPHPRSSRLSIPSSPVSPRTSSFEAFSFSHETKPSFTPPMRQVCELKQVPFKRSLSLGSSPVDLGIFFEKGSNPQRTQSYAHEPLSRPTSTVFSGSPLYFSTRNGTTQEARLEPIPFLCLNDAPGSPYSDYEESAPNSPTGSLKEDRKGGVQAIHSRYSFATANELARSEKTQGRQALCFLNLARCLMAGPLIWCELNTEVVTVSGGKGKVHLVQNED
jgi:hypothetical protein